MAALSEATLSPSPPIHPQPGMPATSDREPAFPHSVTSSQPSLQEGQDGGPSGWTFPWHFKNGQSALEIMGYRARRDMPLRTWAIWRFMFSCTLALLQIIAIGTISGFAFVHREYSACQWLSVSNLVWGGKLLLFQFYPEGWLVYQRLNTGGEPVQGTPTIRFCPLDQATLMNLVTSLEVLFVAIWILVQVVILVVHGERCYAHAPIVSILASILLTLALLYYLPTTGLLAFRRSREHRSDSRDDIEIGPLPQSKVDRIDLRYYIPHPPPAAAAARPSGPVVGSRRVGRASRPQASEQTPRGNGVWENTFQRMPHALLRIAKHEAQCAICLEDYTAPSPRAVPGSATQNAVVADAQGAPEPKPEPLRWLDCGHVFHKGCLDPCLTRGPARCPTCRTPVRVRPPARK